MFHRVHVPREKQPCSRGLFPWREVNGGRPPVISVTVGVGLGLWEVRLLFPSNCPHIHDESLNRAPRSLVARRSGEMFKMTLTRLCVTTFAPV